MHQGDASVGSRLTTGMDQGPMFSNSNARTNFLSWSCTVCLVGPALTYTVEHRVSVLLPKMCLESFFMRAISELLPFDRVENMF